MPAKDPAKYMRDYRARSKFPISEEEEKVVGRPADYDFEHPITTAGKVVTEVGPDRQDIAKFMVEGHVKKVVEDIVAKRSPVKRTEPKQERQFDGVSRFQYLPGDHWVGSLTQAERDAILNKVNAKRKERT